MYYKIPYKLIILIIVCILALTILGVILINSRHNSDNIVNEEDLKNIPQIQYRLSSEEKNQTEVTIFFNVTTENKKGIEKVVFPDMSEEDANGEKSFETSYIVTENGDYKFRAIGRNAQENEITINIENISEKLTYVPYIPEGFHYAEGDIETGYVIEDNFKNQYVWVPVNDGKLVRDTSDNPKYKETDSTASELVNSVAKYYGFYIARYEASKLEGKNENIATTMVDKTPLTSISYIEAEKAVKNAYKYFEYSQEIKIAIINSYAWDTTLNWLNDYSGENGNYSGKIETTGKTIDDIKNNICDLAGNVREWTTECYIDSIANNSNEVNVISNNVLNEVEENTDIKYRILRGGSASSYGRANSHIAYKENMKDDYWGFRMILYK